MYRDHRRAGLPPSPGPVVLIRGALSGCLLSADGSRPQRRRRIKGGDTLNGTKDRANPGRPGTHARAHTHTHVHARTHTQTWVGGERERRLKQDTRGVLCSIPCQIQPYYNPYCDHTFNVTLIVHIVNIIIICIIVCIVIISSIGGRSILITIQHIQYYF